MKYLMTVFVVGLLSYATQAQEATYIVKLKPKKTLKADFTCAKIIDKRLVKTNIGFAQKGMMNTPAKAIFPDGFEPYMQRTMDKLLPKSEDKEALVLIFHELNVSEKTTAFSEKGFCRIAIEFAREQEGQFYSLGFFDAEIQKGGMDVTKKHDDRILEGLAKCVKGFVESDWKNKAGELIEEEETFTYDFKAVPAEGIYASFGKMAKSESIPNVDYHIRTNKANKRFLKFQVYEGKRKTKKRVMYFSDGAHVYINATRYSYGSYFIRSKHLGRYIYFEDRFSDPAAGMAFGLVGAAISTSTKSVILDTETGLVKVLRKADMTNFLKDYPEILKTYNASRKKLKDREAAIIAVNAQFE